MRYPVHIRKEDGDYIATIGHPDGRFQGACSADSREGVLKEAESLLAAMLAEAILSGESIPLPEECERGNAFVILGPMISAKASLYAEMRHQGKRKADIARSLGADQKQVDRILDPRHASTLGQLQSAAGALGRRLDIRLA